MNIFFPSCYFQNNSLKEIYYKSFLVKTPAEIFFPPGKDVIEANYETKKEIMLMDQPWGAAKQSWIRLLGHPRYIIKNKLSSKGEILYFKQEILQEKAIIQCHFHNDRFYYAHIDFVSSLSADSRKIVEQLLYKYRIINVPPGRSMLLKDLSLNKLIIREQVYLQLDYLTGNAGIHQLLRNQINTTEQLQETEFNCRSGYINL